MCGPVHYRLDKEPQRAAWRSGAAPQRCGETHLERNADSRLFPLSEPRLPVGSEVVDELIARAR